MGEDERNKMTRDNIEKNVAYTREYKQLRESFDWLFEKSGEHEESILLGEGEYRAEVFNHTQQYTANNGERQYNIAALITVFDKNDREITQIKAIDEDRVFINLIHHQNGRKYLLYRQDLYGYSVMDVESGETVDFIPKSSFVPVGGKEMEMETFIWCESKYCKTNNLLVVYGCYWACPFEFEFYDFSKPLEVPFHYYGDSYSLQKKMGIEFAHHGIDDVDFNESGECVFKIENDDKNMAKTISVDVMTNAM